ncbi:MAG: hypothetical protein ACRBBQ_17775 [Cognatishimia sp.]
MIVYSLLFSTLITAAYLIMHPSGVAFVIMRAALGLAFGITVVGARFFISRLALATWRSRGFSLSQMAFSSLPVIATLFAVPIVNLSSVQTLFAIPALLATMLAITLSFCNSPQIGWRMNSPQMLRVSGLSWNIAASSSIVYSISYGALIWIANLPNVSSNERVLMLVLVLTMSILGSIMVWRFSDLQSTLYSTFTFMAFGSSLLFFVFPTLGLAAVSFSIGAIMPLSLSLFLHSAGITAAPVSIIGSLHLVGGFAGASVAQFLTGKSGAQFAVFVAAAGAAAVIEVLSQSKRLRM